MTKFYSYELDDGTFINERPNSNVSYTEWVSLFPKPGYCFQNIYTGKILETLITPLGTEDFWKEILLVKEE